MSNQISTRNEQERNVPVHNAPNDFRHMMSHFWNMLDFPHHHEMESMEPRIEVAENKNNITVTAELPGVAEEDIDVEISSDGYLTISGEKHNENEVNQKGNYFSEISYGMVQRTIPLPWDLQLEAADAEYNDGVLRIEIPKSAIEQQKKKKVAVAHNTKRAPKKTVASAKENINTMKANNRSEKKAKKQPAKNK